MKIISLILLFSSICLLMPGCDPDGDCDKRQSKALRDGIEDAIPYQDGEIRHFKTTEGDTFTVRVTRIYQVNKPDAPLVCEEYLEVLLKDPNSSYPFVESVQRGLSVDSMIQMVVSPRRLNGTGTIVQFYLTPNRQLAGFDNGNYTAQLHAALEIDGKTYQDVLQLDYTFADDSNDVTRFYYNQTYGILQCRTQGGMEVTRME